MRLWRFINIYSIDVALGAVAGCAFFAAIFDVSLLLHAYLSLGLIVWMIYTVDHLVDARNSTGEPSTERHRYHKRHSRLLTLSVIVAGVVVAFEAFYVRKPVLFAGIGLTVLVMGYLVLQATLKFAKELAGAMLYTSGILAGPWSILDRPLAQPEMGLIVLFGMTAFINLLLFSWFDLETDRKDNHVSFATIFGERITQWAIAVCFAFVGGAGALLVVTFPGYMIPIVVMLLMNVLLYLTFQYRAYFMVDDRYRRLGDLVFLIPGSYLFYTHALEWF